MDIKKLKTVVTNDLQEAWFELKGDELVPVLVADVNENTDRDRTFFKIARITNKDYNKEIFRLVQEHRRVTKRAKLTDEEQLEVARKATARKILTGWASLYSDGNEYPYTEENAIAILDDAFLELVLTTAKQSDAFYNETLREDMDALKKTSPGS